MDNGFKATWADEEEDAKYEFGFWWGLVSNNADPSNRGRVRIRIPGMNETESTWAEQCGSPGFGGGKHGMWAVPKVGSLVVVGFIQGDIDSPFYIPGPVPIGEQPDGAKPDNVIFQTDNFRLSFIENKDAKKVRLETLVPEITVAKQDQVRSVIEIDINTGPNGKAHVINIIAPSGINITSQGTINIDAPVLTLKGRTVMPSNGTI
jgi:hypothetical protein